MASRLKCERFGISLPSRSVLSRGSSRKHRVAVAIAVFSNQRVRHTPFGGSARLQDDIHLVYELLSKYFGK